MLLLRMLIFYFQMCIEGARHDLCLATLPVSILSDAFDCITIQQCEELFEFVESNVSVWKEELFFSHCKNQFLRMCNGIYIFIFLAEFWQLMP